MSKSIIIKGLPIDVCSNDVDKLCYKYGKVNKIQKCNPNVFVTYDDEKDADDAIQDLNNSYFSGKELTVKIYNGNIPIQKQNQNHISFNNKKSSCNFNVKNATCSVNINEDGHGFIKIEF